MVEENLLACSHLAKEPSTLYSTNPLCLWSGSCAPRPCFLSVMHTTVGFCMCFLLHSSLSYLIHDVPSVMLPRNVMAITLASLCSSPSHLYGIIRKPFTLTPMSVHWKLSLLHDKNCTFIHLLRNPPYLVWILRSEMTHDKCQILFLNRKRGSALEVSQPFHS